MKIEATLRIPGELNWIGDDVEPRAGLCIRGRPPEWDLLLDGRVIGRLVGWPRANAERFYEDTKDEPTETVVLDTTIDCILDLEALVAA